MSQGVCKSINYLIQALRSFRWRCVTISNYIYSYFIPCCRTQLNCQSPKITRRRSIHSLDSISTGGFSGQLSAKGPVYKKVSPVPLTCMTLAQTSFSPLPPINTPWNDVLEKLHHNHSFEHNYEDKLSKIKMNFKATLEQMSSESPNPNPWGTVKIIDFVHAFFNEEEEDTIDENFCEGIDNFVKIFESFIDETSDHVI